MYALHIIGKHSQISTLNSLIHPHSPHTTCLRAQERLLLEGETVTRGIQDPGVVVGALHAGVQPQGLPGQLPRVERAGVGERAVGLALHITLLLPLSEVAQGRQLGRVLHPLDDLRWDKY